MFKFVRELKYWLFGIAAALITLHVNLTFRSANNDLLSSSWLFGIAVAFLIEKKRNTLKLESDVLSTVVGALLISLLLCKSINLSRYDHFLRIFPLFSLLGLGLLASGFKGLNQYWQELLLFVFFAVPPGLISLFIDISILTAKFTAFILSFLSFEVSRQGVNVILPTGSIEVYHGCSGMSVILQLLGIALIILFMLNTNANQKVLLPVGAIIIGFTINGVRVALMAILVSSYNQEAFKYWHIGNGSLIFSTITVLIFGLYSHFLLRDLPKPLAQ